VPLFNGCDEARRAVQGLLGSSEHLAPELVPAFFGVISIIRAEGGACVVAGSAEVRGLGQVVARVPGGLLVAVTFVSKKGKIKGPAAWSLDIAWQAVTARQGAGD